MARFLLSTVLLALFLGHSATALKCAKGVAKPSDSFLKLADVGIPITRMRDRLKPCTSEDPTVTPQCYRVTIGDDLTFAGCTTETLPFLNEVGIDICQTFNLGNNETNNGEINALGKVSIQCCAEDNCNTEQNPVPTTSPETSTSTSSSVTTTDPITTTGCGALNVFTLLNTVLLFWTLL
uniref:UPAR/Ly6 domain-containing protein n=1 Tax=Steinernema glaseri TaxID=37863 RepID=A0A1I8AM39_9BILA